MQSTAGVAQVVFDAADRRFEGQVHLSRNGVPHVLTVSAPGHPAWGYRRIRRALIAAAQLSARKETRNARV